MVERRFKASIFAVASFWYSAWIDAGQPKLLTLTQSNLTEDESLNYEQKKILGREEWH